MENADVKIIDTKTGEVIMESKASKAELEMTIDDIVINKLKSKSNFGDKCYVIKKVKSD